MDFIPQLTLPVWVEAMVYIGSIASAYIVGKFREKKKRVMNDKHNAEIDWEVHSQIHEFLTELRVRTHAGRAQVIQFHNGEYFIDGISMHKMSTTHESLKNGLSSDAKKLLLVTMFSALMEKLEKNEPHLYKVSNEKPSYFKNTLDLASVDYYMALPLFYSNSAKTGLILLEWCDDTDSEFAVANENQIQLEMMHIRNIIQTKLSQQLKDRK
jgi:hypothetical protein